MEETTIVQRPLGDLRQSSQHTVSVLGTDQYIRDGTRVQHGNTYQEKLLNPLTILIMTQLTAVSTE